MKNYKSLLVLTIGALLMTACGGTSDNTKSKHNVLSVGGTDVVVPTYSSELERIVLDSVCLNMLVGEKDEIGCKYYYPVTAKKQDITFTSSDSSIVTVDNAGKVVAVGAGRATITVATVDGKLSKIVDVNVFNKLSTRADAQPVAKAIEEVQDKDDFKPVDKVFVKENYKSIKSRKPASSSKNYVQQKFILYDQELTVSKPDAYFKIEEFDVESKCEGGAYMSDYIKYIFYTTEDFQTFIIKESNAAKRYMIVDVSTYIPVANGRYAALAAVLDNFFVSGIKIVDNQIEDAVGNGDLSRAYGTKSSKWGSNGEGSLCFTYKQSNGSQIDKSEESDIEIPTGTAVTINDNIRFAYYDNYSCGQDLVEDMSYTLGEYDYKNTYDIQYSYQRDNIELEYPDLKGYQLVADLFEL